MGYDIQMPNITSPYESGRIEQIRTYLYQLAEQLNWALNTIDQGVSSKVVYKGGGSTASDMTEEQAKATFNSIKSLIISSADIVNAFSTKFAEKYNGSYMAQSDFGTYIEETEQVIEKNSQSVESLYTNIQKIITDIATLEYALIEVNARIHSGLLEIGSDGIPVYGVEVGQTNTVDGVEVFNKYARFTSDRLSFYDQNDTEVAYVSDRKLYIADVEVISSLKIGGFIDIVQSNGDVVEKWVGRG